MEQKISASQLQSRSKDIFSQINVHVFVDGNDLGGSLQDTPDLDYITKNVDRSVRRITHYCRTFGYVQEAYVFDDDWEAIDGKAWTKEGFECIDVLKDTNSDSRVGRVFTLRVYQIAMQLSGTAAFILLVGGTDYQELIEALKKKGFRVVLIGIEDYLTEDVKQTADVWVPFHKAVPDIKKGIESNLVIEEYDWTKFISLIASLEKSDLNFVGVKYLIRTVLPDIGLTDLSEAHTVIEEAEAKGILEMYQVKNPNGTYPVRACRLLRSNDVVKEILTTKQEEE